jgi:hypothetical protein
MAITVGNLSRIPLRREGFAAPEGQAIQPRAVGLWLSALHEAQALDVQVLGVRGDIIDVPQDCRCGAPDEGVWEVRAVGLPEVEALVGCWVGARYGVGDGGVDEAKGALRCDGAESPRILRVNGVVDGA